MNAPYGNGPTPPYWNPMPPPVPPAHDLALVSVILGALGFQTLITGPLAIIFAAVARSKGNRETLSTVGLILGIISTALGILLIAVYVFFLVSLGHAGFFLRHVIPRC